MPENEKSSKERSGENLHWSVWRDEKTSTWKLGCSLCDRKIENAIVIPSKALRICFRCIDEMSDAAKKNQVSSIDSDAGPISDSVSEPSRDDAPKKGGVG